MLINGTDIWEEYGVFLTEERRGSRENLNAILSPSKVKEHVGVRFREADGAKYSNALTVKNEEREVTLHFAQYAATRAEWLGRYRAFMRFLKAGQNGWLNITFPELNLTLRVFYVDCSGYRSLTYLWQEGVQAGRYRVRFKEPDPVI